MSAHPAHPRIAILGASLDTGNLGVSALLLATLSTIARRMPAASVTVFDHGWGAGAVGLDVDETSFTYRRCGLRLSRRVHRRESLANVRLSARLGIGNAVLDELRHADAVLDVSGGDSFSDLYGKRRFRAITLPKLVALDQGVPLVLLPQTYGPFFSQAARRVASDLVSRASMAWARDADSFDELRDLLGESFDPDRHRAGVDLAFVLDAAPPADGLPEPLDRWLAADRGAPVVGLNVSGLLFDRTAASPSVRADYRTAVAAILRRVLAETDARVVLVPHVVAGTESDEVASRSLLATVGDHERDRVTIASNLRDPRHVKWLVGRLDWFVGTRMHSTIAALSSGVPAAAVAYSPKTRGVFATCGLGEDVHDARSLDTDQLVTAVWDSWERRDSARRTLAARLPWVRHTAEAQLDAILGSLARPRVSAAPAS